MAIAPACAPCRCPEANTSEPPTPLDLLVSSAWVLRSRPHLVHAHLRDVLRDPDHLAAIAARSYWHSNGFAKVRMVEGCGYSARLHIWPAGVNRFGDTDPHGHRWEFASWVAAGAGMHEQYFTVADPDDRSGTPYDRHCYLRRPDGSGGLERIGPSFLRVEQEFRRERGEIYRCPTNVLHTVKPIGDALVVTVVLQGRVSRRSADVYLPRGQRPNVFERPLETGELSRLLRAADEVLPERKDFGSSPSRGRERSVVGADRV